MSVSNKPDCPECDSNEDVEVLDIDTDGAECYCHGCGHLFDKFWD